MPDGPKTTVCVLLCHRTETHEPPVFGGSDATERAVQWCYNHFVLPADVESVGGWSDSGDRIGGYAALAEFKDRLRAYWLSKRGA
jgi:hypothetical protein